MEKNIGCLDLYRYLVKIFTYIKNIFSDDTNPFHVIVSMQMNLEWFELII